MPCCVSGPIPRWKRWRWLSTAGRASSATTWWRPWTSWPPWRYPTRSSSWNAGTRCWNAAIMRPAGPIPWGEISARPFRRNGSCSAPCGTGRTILSTPLSSGPWSCGRPWNRPFPKRIRALPWRSSASAISGGCPLKRMWCWICAFPPTRFTSRSCGPFPAGTRRCKPLCWRMRT